MEGKRNNRAVEESGKGRENETVETRSLEKRKAEKHNCYKEKERERAKKNRVLIGAVTLVTQKYRRTSYREYARRHSEKKKTKEEE